MERRTTKKPIETLEFLCLCAALGDKDVTDEAWAVLNRLSGRDAESILQGLETFEDVAAEPVLEAAQLFLSSRVWKKSA